MGQGTFLAKELYMLRLIQLNPSIYSSLDHAVKLLKVQGLAVGAVAARLEPGRAICLCEDTHRGTSSRHACTVVSLMQKSVYQVQKPQLGLCQANTQQVLGRALKLQIGLA